MKRDRYSPTKATGATKVIAFWDPLLRKALGSPNIPVRNHWSMTCHLLYKNETFNDADVIFDMRHNILLNNPETFPDRTRSDQLYFLFNYEAPLRVIGRLDNHVFKDKFNLTVTYPSRLSMPGNSNPRALVDYLIELDRNNKNILNISNGEVFTRCWLGHMIYVTSVRS